MPSNQDFPDLSETSGRFSVVQTYWTHFLAFQRFFETVIVKKKISLTQLLVCFLLVWCWFFFVCKVFILNTVVFKYTILQTQAHFYNFEINSIIQSIAHISRLSKLNPLIDVTDKTYIRQNTSNLPDL